MIVLGLHFGHDASVTVLKDGEVLLCYERERGSRFKHALSLSIEDIELSLKDVGLNLADVDFCSLTSTQLVEYIALDRQNLSLRLGLMPAHKYPCTLVNKLDVTVDKMLERQSGWVRKIGLMAKTHPYQRLLPTISNYIADDRSLFGGFEHYITTPVWEERRRLSDIARTNYSQFIAEDDVRQGFHYPAIVSMRGRDYPAYVFSHHVAHMAYTFYGSPYEEAAILSHDGAGGGGDYGCGFFGYGKGNKLYPLTPHHLSAGEIYDEVGVRIGFDSLGAAGKLMGLSAYGKPRFFERRFVGNWYDLGRPAAAQWSDHCLAMAKRFGYDLDRLGKKDDMLAPINVDIAASTQKLVEEILLASCESLHNTVLETVGPIQNLCLSGGIALNCPSNTRIWNESSFKSIHVPPAVSDMGLSIGSAQALYHNVMGFPRRPLRPTSPTDAYLGLNGSDTPSQVLAAVEKYSDRLQVEKSPDTPALAAQDLADNKVVAWFEGRSEIGPRALGHRSILANATVATNWERVNQIKKREFWRPFAPAVLADRCADLFTATQMPSYFMLLNAEVRVNDYPAITHADRSARIQSVTRECGRFYDVLAAFDRLTGHPVIMNTSFNGPGEPIIETPSEAVEFLLSTELDALYLGEFRLSRKVKI